MAKRQNLLIVSLALSLPSLSLIFSYSSNAVVALNNEYNGTWVHYSKKEASKDEDGIREYYVLCGGNEYRFSKPSSNNIIEATNYDTTGFTSDDPRWIKWIDESKLAFFDLSNNSIDTSEVNLTSYSLTSDIDKIVGETYRCEYVKDDLSPMYSISTLVVNGIISSKDDLNDFVSSIDGKTSDGYYVFTSNIDSPSKYVGSNTVFKGTFDGRNHIINKPSFWGSRLFGKLENATIKNLSFENVSIFSILSTDITSSTIENCSFSVSNNPNSSSGTGFLTDNINDDVVFKNINIDYKKSYFKCAWGDFIVTPIAGYNKASDGHETIYDNVTVSCLDYINMYVADTMGRSLRPSQINYVDTNESFIKDGNITYSIKSDSSNFGISKLNTYLSDEIYRITSKRISITNISSSDVVSDNENCIVIGSNLSETGLSVPSDTSSCLIRSKNKTIYVNASDIYGYQLAGIALLNKLFGYEYYGENSYSLAVKDINNINVPYIDISYAPSIGYRKCDWSDDKAASGVISSMYNLGYNAGYGDYSFFMGVPAIGEFTSYQQFHTGLQLLYPGTYYESHPNWYGVDSNNNLLGSSYSEYQFCFTARGNETEYQALVNEASKNIIARFKANTDQSLQSFLFGTGDNHNRCHCSSCEASIATYGSISGSEMKFINDVRDEIYKDPLIASRKINLGMFAYLEYKEAPVINGVPTIKAKDNVFVFLAPIEANFTYSLEDPINSSIASLFSSWSKIANIYAWLYETNFHNYLFPFNSFKAIPESLRFISNYNVELAYIQGQHNITQPSTGFTSLKKYLDGKFMVDVNSNYESLLSSFFPSYFGEGYTYMRSFFDEMVARLTTIETTSKNQSVLYKNDSRSVYQNISDRSLFDKDELKKWVSYCDSASNATTNEEAKRHILIESIFPRFALASLFTKSTDWGTIFDGSSILKEFRQDFKADCESLGISRTSESAAFLSSYYEQWGIN